MGLAVVLFANFFMCNADYLIRTKTPLRISTILTPAFTRLRGSGSQNSDYVGFIPELISALKDRKVFNNYLITQAPGNMIGQRQSNGNWTGLMHEVISGKQKVIGAGPILDNNTYKAEAKLSSSWATVYLTLVVKKTSNATTLREVLDKQMSILAVSGSPELAELRKQSSTDLSDLQSRIDQTNRFADTVEKGLQHVAREDKSGLLMNSEEAKYYVTHDFCNLTSVGKFHQLGGYVFVLERDDMTLEKLNQKLKEMKTDGSLDKLRDKELGMPGTCSKGSAFHLEKIVAILFATAAVISAQIRY